MKLAAKIFVLGLLLLDAAAGHAGEALDFLKVEDFGARHELHIGLRHAIETAQIAIIRE